LREIYLKVNNVSKNFGKECVLKGVSVDVKKGEFLTILGNSGSGKTTLLRIIAGLEYPDGGRIILDGEDITELAPEKRRLNMVFQNYALFEHMNVRENVGYSLKFLKISKSERERRTENILESVGLTGMEEKLPSQLSGGQKQRVAIARAIINEPKMLLLDEPLGALDRNLRKHLQQEFKDMQKRLGITCIYITHDQEEAIFLSDRIAVLADGHFIQTDTVSNIIGSKDSYVRAFLGERIETKK